MSRACPTSYSEKAPEQATLPPPWQPTDQENNVDSDEDGEKVAAPTIINQVSATAASPIQVKTEACIPPIQVTAPLTPQNALGVGRVSQAEPSEDKQNSESTEDKTEEAEVAQRTQDQIKAAAAAKLSSALVHVNIDASMTNAATAKEKRGAEEDAAIQAGVVAKQVRNVTIASTVV